MTFVRNIATLLLIFSCFTFSGCYKLKDVFVMKGEWVVNSIEINGGSTNQMEAILPNYVNGNGKYVIYFGDEGKLATNYMVEDTLNYAVAGEWRLIDHQSLYLNADRFVKGTFEVEEQSINEILLYSEGNYVEFYGIGKVEMLIRARRD